MIEDDAGTHELPVVASRADSRRRPWYTRPFALVAAVTALAGGLRFYHLSTPHQYVFDEVYYAKDACFDAGFPYRQCKLDAPSEQTQTVHPPLGRWIIAGGVAAFGNRSFGWRFASAVFGTLSVFLIALLALRLWGSALWAGVAGLLLATENLNFVQSRIAMLDIFVTAFVIAGFLFVVLDRQWMERRTPPPPEPDESTTLLRLPPDGPPSPVFRPWRIAAGVALGAAAASKWSGGTALAAAIVISIVWERSRRAQYGVDHPLREALRDEGFGIFAFLVILPLLVYIASYARWWADHGLGSAGWNAWIGLQREMATYSLHLRATHPYASRPWWWVLLKRPVAYYYTCTHLVKGTCTTPAEILAIGNPFIFWGTVFAIPYAAYAWVRKHDWRAGLIVVAFALQYLPWFAAFRTSFLFYMAPITPFMVLAVVYGVRDLSEVRLGAQRVRALAPVAGLVVLASVVLFAFFLPVLTGRPLSMSAWNLRMWFRLCSPKASWCWI